MKNTILLSLIILLSACSSNEPRSAATAATTYVDPISLLGQSSTDADLALEVWHRVVSPLEIHGVIVIHHIGINRVSLVDRWNSWGSDQ